MWQANKVAIIILLAGLALLGGLHYYLAPTDAVLAKKIEVLGICLLLFGVGTYSLLTALKGPRP